MGNALSEHGSARLHALRAALAERTRLVGGGVDHGGHAGHVGRADHVDHGVEHLATGWPAIDEALGGGIPCRGLHEWWGALSDARAVCVQLAWRSIVQDDRVRAGALRHVAWVGRDAWPGAGDLVRGLRAPLAGMFGGAVGRTWPDARLHDRSLLVDVPARDAGARLWAIEQAARCTGVCAVVADGRDLDLAATRRLQLSASGVLLLALRGPECRPGARRAALSACTTRWTVERFSECGAGGHAHAAARIPWLRAAHPLAARVLPEPAWTVTLERAKGMAMAALHSACSAQAVHHWQWEGMAVPPAAEAAQASRRAARAARLGAERAQRRTTARRAGEDDGGLVAPTASIGPATQQRATGMDAPASPVRTSGGAEGHRGRHRAGRDRMTSRGEHWARTMEGHVA